jgi:N-acetylglucosamine-6-phosphate deacetylase
MFSCDQNVVFNIFVSESPLSLAASTLCVSCEYDEDELLTRESTRLHGKLPGSSAVVQIDYGTAIEHADELIRPLDEPDFVAPGFIDFQVNGFAGVDYNDPAAEPEAIARSIRKMFATGVTRFFPTVITGSKEHMLRALRNLARAKEEMIRSGLPEGEAMEAFHVEGPHISPAEGPRGAHPLEHVRPPDIDEFERWQDAAAGHIRLVTLSPEWPGAATYVEHLHRSGVVASIGHTQANSIQIRAAVDAGASLSTHLGNAALSVMPKTDNCIWDQLADDRLMAAFIADGLHVPPSFLKAALRAKGIERSVLVTDAVMPAMCLPGPYRLGQVEVELRENGSVVLRGGSRLAGSVLRMDQAVANTVRMAGIPLANALAMATQNAARAVRIAGRLRGIVPGEKADLVRFRWDEASSSLTVIETIVAGTSVYST